MKQIGLTAWLIGWMLIQVPLVHAASVRVDQTWEARGFENSGLHASTVAIFSDGGITGVGSEAVLVDYFAMIRYRNGIGQNFFLAAFPVPLAPVEGAMRAHYNNGMFQFLGHIDQGGSARIALIDGNTGGGAGGLNIGGGELIWHIPVSGTERYDLTSTTVTTTPIPLPGMLIALIPALAWLGRFRPSRARSCAATMREGG